jgi:alpha-glucosidase
MRLGRVQEVQQTDAGVQITCEGGSLRLVFDECGALAVTAGRELGDDHSWVVSSSARTLRPSITEDDRVVSIRAGDTEAVVARADARVELWAAGRKIFANLALAFSAIEFAIVNEMPPDERYFGFGSKAGRFDRRGARLLIKNRDPYIFNRGTEPLYLSIPFFVATRRDVSYGFLLDSHRETTFDLRSEKMTIRSRGGRPSQLTYYLIPGPGPADVLRRYTEVSGRTPLPPLWALGYHQSRWSYQSEAEVLEVAREFRRRRIPCDSIHLDIHYMDGYRCFTWNPRDFPNPERVIEELRALGMRAVAVIDPGIKVDPGFSVYADGVLGDRFLKHRDGTLFEGYVWPGKCVFPDFTKPEVREWWAGLHQTLLEKGVAGIWNDMNEPTYDLFAPSFPAWLDLPANALQPVLQRVFPVKTGDVIFDDEGRQTPFDDAHNAYALLQAKATNHAFEVFAEGQRPFVLSRSGSAGIQRHAAVWTADSMSTWDQLKLSVEMLLNLGLSGVPFVGADIGGFAPLALRRPFVAPCSPELYARWLQVGIFYPFCRTHSAKQSRRREPWRFGDKVERIARKYLELRYRLLPYLYSLFWEHTQNGMPIMRAMFLHHPADENCYRGDQFLFGPSILVAPVFQKGAKGREVYLPEGDWYDFWTGQMHRGGRSVFVGSPLEKIPLFVEAGAIVPTWPAMNFVGEKSIERVTIEVYPGSGEFTWYEDDGQTLGSASAVRRLATRVRGNALEVEVGPREGAYSPPRRELAVLGRWLTPPRATLDGLEVPFAAGPEGAEVRLADDGQPHLVTFELTR